MLRGPMSTNLKSIAIGDVNFASMIADNSLYVDKTSSIEQLIKDKSKTVLFTRPRRFGKTLSLDMLRCFLEMNYENPKDKSFQENLFKDLAIFKNQEFCANHMGHYPVIYLSFKDVKGSSFKNSLEIFNQQLYLVLDQFNSLGFGKEIGKNNLKYQSLKRKCEESTPSECKTLTEVSDFSIALTSCLALLTKVLH